MAEEQGLSWQEYLDVRLVKERVWTEQRMEEIRALLCKEMEWKVVNVHELWEAKEMKRREKEKKKQEDEKVVKTCQENMKEKWTSEKMKWEEKRIQEKERQLEEEWKKMEAERSQVEEMKMNERIDLEVLRKRLKEGEEKLRESETLEKQRKKVLDEERDRMEKDRIKLKQERREVAELKAELDQLRLDMEGLRLRETEKVEREYSQKKKALEEEKRRLHEDRERMRKEQEQHLKELEIQREKLEQSEVALKEKAAQKKEKFLLKKQELESECQTIETEKKRMEEELKVVQEQVYVLKSQLLEEEGQREMLRTQEAINRANLEQEWRMFEIEKRRLEDMVETGSKKMKTQQLQLQEEERKMKAKMEMDRRRLEDKIEMERKNLESQRFQLQQEERQMKEKATMKMEIEKRKMEDQMEAQRRQLQDEERKMKEKAAMKKEKMNAKMKEAEEECEKIERERRSLERTVSERVAQRKKELEDEWKKIDSERKAMETRLENEIKKIESQRQKLVKMEKEHWQELEKEEERILDKLNAEKRKLERKKKWLDTERKELDCRLEGEQREMEIEKEKLEATEKRLLHKHARRQQRDAMRKMEVEEEWMDIKRRIESEKKTWLNNDAKTAMEPVSIGSCSMDAEQKTFSRKPKAVKGAAYEKQKHAAELSPSDSDDDPWESDGEATLEYRKPIHNIALKHIVKKRLEEGPVVTERTDLMPKPKKSPVKKEGTGQDKKEPKSNVEITDSSERSEDKGHGTHSLASAETKPIGNSSQATGLNFNNNNAALKSIMPWAQVQQIVTGEDDDNHSPIDSDVKSKSALVVETSGKKNIPTKTEGMDKDSAMKLAESVPAEKRNDVSDQDHALLQQKASDSNSQMNTNIPKTLKNGNVCTPSPNTMEEKPSANALPPMTSAKNELKANCIQDNTDGLKKISSTAVEESMAPQIQPVHESMPSPAEMVGKPPANPEALLHRVKNDDNPQAKTTTQQPWKNDIVSRPSPAEMVGKPPANPLAFTTPQVQDTVTNMDESETKPSPLMERKEKIPGKGEGMDKDIDIKHIESVPTRKGQVLTAEGEREEDTAEEDDEYSPWEESDEYDSEVEEAKIIPKHKYVDKNKEDNTHMGKPSMLTDAKENAKKQAEFLDVDELIEGESKTTDKNGQERSSEKSPTMRMDPLPKKPEALLHRVKNDDNPQAKTTTQQPWKNDIVSRPSPREIVGKPPVNPPAPMTPEAQGSVTPMEGEESSPWDSDDESESKPSPLVERKEKISGEGKAMDKDIDIKHVESVPARKGQVLTTEAEMKDDEEHDDESPWDSDEDDCKVTAEVGETKLIHRQEEKVKTQDKDCLENKKDNMHMRAEKVHSMPADVGADEKQADLEVDLDLLLEEEFELMEKEKQATSSASSTNLMKQAPKKLEALTQTLGGSNSQVSTKNPQPLKKDSVLTPLPKAPKRKPSKQDEFDQELDDLLKEIDIDTEGSTTIPSFGKRQEVCTGLPKTTNKKPSKHDELDDLLKEMDSDSDTQKSKNTPKPCKKDIVCTPSPKATFGKALTNPLAPMAPPQNKLVGNGRLDKTLPISKANPLPPLANPLSSRAVHGKALPPLKATASVQSPISSISSLSSANMGGQYRPSPNMTVDKPVTPSIKMEDNFDDEEDDIDYEEMMREIEETENRMREKRKNMK
ncbi:zinc finger CCCH domain-containing protein 13-like [Engraulis encrasicolus]|uniref:zinc finger CCCH domain-containing protein 13-like n=1 Tax=Engraulis encrasicolus TaxID=184585 RepID=UPI002FD43129